MARTKPVRNYEEQVYTAVLGKVVGVYLGRPFEGWTKRAIEERFGEIDRYVHEDLGHPLVVADDDISGTFTFVRALEDSGLFADTPPEFFGKTWLNYLLEKQTVLWWGGMSHSTEHTAFIRLKHGVPSPESGSMKLNGREVSEQIGAQIFIDAFGMVCAGRPELAARLARMAAGVSHDGEAVLAAQVVAAMVAAAFTVKDMDALLDIGVSVISADSLVAQVHRDVRAWARKDRDWRRTYDRIDEKYGYGVYDGNCHVIPNHALMVMAWAYGQRDFYKTMRIVATAGWDTDCNAANVGSVSALVCGLGALSEPYDFRSPFADRVVIPTADGTDSVTDCANIARRIARIGRRILDIPPASAPSPKDGAWHAFDLPGALHGYMPDDATLRTRGNATVFSAPASDFSGGESGMQIVFKSSLGRVARVTTPVLMADGGSRSYSVVSTPALYHGTTVVVRGYCSHSEDGPATIRMVVDTVAENGGRATSFGSQRVRLRSDGSFALRWTVDSGHATISAFGFEIESAKPAYGVVFIHSVHLSGAAETEASGPFGGDADPRCVPGWISNFDRCRGDFRNASVPAVRYYGKDDGLGIMVAGSRSWRDAQVSCDFKIHAADRAGLVLAYQGMQRFYAVMFTRSSVQIVRNHYGETVLAEVPFVFGENTARAVVATLRRGRIAVSVDGAPLVSASDSTFDCGGAGFCVDTGLAGPANLRIRASL